MPLHILIADADVNSALTTAQLLMNNGHLVETCNDGVHALQAIQRRIGANKAYHVVIASYRLAGMDAMRLFTELRMNNIAPALALCTHAGVLTPQLRTEALKLGCKTFFDYPIPLNHLNDFVAGVMNQSRGSDAPYFGTSKLSKNAEHEISGGHSLASGSNSYQRTPSNSTQRQAGYNAQSSGAFHMAPSVHTTQRVRRGATGSFTESNNPTAPQAPASPIYQAPVQQAPVRQAPQQVDIDQHFPQTGQYQNSNHASTQQPVPLPPGTNSYSPQTTGFTNVNGGTQRIRRSTTGSFAEETGRIQKPAPVAAAQVQAQTSYQVACAHCRQAFVVINKSQEYNAVCIHCGGLNRILPLQ